MLNGLSPTQRESVLKLMADKDPQMAEFLKSHLINFEDLKLISQKMLAELLQEIKLDDLALGLRGGSDNLKSFILDNVSQSTKDQIIDVLDGPPRKLSDVEAAIDKVMRVVRSKHEKGQLVFIDPEKDELV